LRLPRRLHWRRTSASVAETAAIPVGRDGADEDARILRRTRLRLMAVSAAVTLVILLVLGGAVYEIVATAVVNGDRAQLESLERGRADTDVPQAPTFEGAAAGLIPIPIDTSGQPVVLPGVSRIPPGLPSQASLSAVNPDNPFDIREVVAKDGTPYRVISGYTRSGLLYQYAQNRTSEVNFLNTLAGVMLVGGLLALLAALIAGYMYAGRALVPIRQSIDRRQGALQRQREFAANASHELRTPLTVIRTSVEDLKRNRRSRVEDVGEALDDIESEVGTVTALVDDMLLLARTDSGAVQLDRVPLDLSDVAAEATALARSLGAERGVAIMFDPLPASTAGDPLRLRQLVTILVDNAIRHSPAGSTVQVRVRPEPEAAAALLLVEDQGPGIKPEDLPRLWDRFWRADSAPAGGTGLGLAIAKWIVEQHGGAIGAGNRDEGGARFWVRLPRAAAPQSAAQHPVAGAVGGELTIARLGSGPETSTTRGPAEPPPGPADTTAMEGIRWATLDGDKPVT
jgi:signal transduction histidine kinase